VARAGDQPSGGLILAAAARQPESGLQTDCVLVVAVPARPLGRALPAHLFSYAKGSAADSRECNVLC